MPQNQGNGHAFRNEDDFQHIGAISFFRLDPSVYAGSIVI